MTGTALARLESIIKTFTNSHNVIKKQITDKRNKTIGKYTKLESQTANQPTCGTGTLKQILSHTDRGIDGNDNRNHSKLAR